MIGRHWPPVAENSTKESKDNVDTSRSNLHRKSTTYLPLSPFLALLVLSLVRTFTMGIAGTTNGSFHACPDWIDQKKRPGENSLLLSGYNSPGWFYKIFTDTFSILFTPNIIWLLITVAVYLCFPYNYDMVLTQGKAVFLSRLVINYSVVFLYFSYWHVSLYGLGFSKRPFVANRVYNIFKTMHNWFYFTLGIIQWTIWEYCFLYLYASRRLPFLSDAVATSSGYQALLLGLALLFVPTYRNFHFYFAHRLLHIKVLYRYTHSLHHRVVDTEPFSGLSMHPVEHLYYYSCAGLSLYMFSSPLCMLWNGYHLLLSPGASHSGWEDHFQADLFHYLHHRFFDCNYGVNGAPPFDAIFGTFREALSTSLSYKGAAVEEMKLDDKKASQYDMKARLGLPKISDFIYNYICFVIFVIFACSFIVVIARNISDNPVNANNDFIYVQHLLVDNVLNYFNIYAYNISSRWIPMIMGLLVATGPIILSCILLLIFDFNSKNESGYRLITYPFHKESIFGSFGFHCLVGVLGTVVPTYHLVFSCFADALQSPYCVLYQSC